MTHNYNISGMTCGACVAKVKSELLKLSDVTEANVKLTAPQATISMQKHIAVDTLQGAIKRAGNFTISEISEPKHHQSSEATASWLATYKPILILFAYITGISLLLEANRGFFSWEEWMQNFMAAFFSNLFLLQNA